MYLHMVCILISLVFSVRHLERQLCTVAQLEHCAVEVSERTSHSSTAGYDHRMPFMPTKNHGLKIRRPRAAPVVEAGTWTPAQGKLSGAAAPDHRASKHSHNSTPPKTSAKCPGSKEGEREQEIKRKEEAAEALRKCRLVLEKSKQTERAMEIHTEREALKQTQNAVQADCSLMETSGMPPPAEQQLDV